MPRRLVLGVAVLISLVVIGAAVFGNAGLRQYRRLRAEAAALAAQNRSLTEENRRLTEEVMRLKDDDSYIEKVARDQLGHIKPGETVLVLPQADSPSRE